MSGRVLVIGGSIDGVQAALDIADSGIEVELVERSASLHIEAQQGEHLLRPKILEAMTHRNIRMLTGAEVVQAEGSKGSFRVRVLLHPRYVSEEACTSCGRCQQSCPASVPPQLGTDGHKAIHPPSDNLKSVPSTYCLDKIGVAPCTAACPAGVNVQGYVALISQGKFKQALDLIREAVPFPHILGRVCTHPCEDACTRGKVDQPIGIASLKRFVADNEAASGAFSPIEAKVLAGRARVAIVGAGPGGLTCARDLLRYGHNVTVFEALPVAGGMIAVGMPRFRLPREVRQMEINALVKLGIEIRTATPIGKDLRLDDLRRMGYEAIFVATGAHKNQKLDIPGEELDGVIDSVSFLRALNLKQPVRVGYNVVVVGGGYTAIDSARTAARLHCKKVLLLYRRTVEEMAATKAEILETVEEGVDLELLVSPTRIIGEDGKVVGIECQRMKLGRLDKSGRRAPVPIEGSEFVIDADTVITAIGQLPDLEVLNGDLHVPNDGTTISVDPLTLSTSVPGIFAGGDVVSGPGSIVEAMAAGRRAAVSIDRYLRGEDMKAGRTLERILPVEVSLEGMKVPPGKRRRIPCLPKKKRVGNFEEVETGYTTWMAFRESKRCLNCGGCSECMECVRACEMEAIKHDMHPEEREIDVGAIVVASGGEQAGGRLVADQAGVYRTGSVPDDGHIPDSLTSASAAAAKAMIDLARYRSGAAVAEGTGSSLRAGSLDCDERRIGVFLCRCGGAISDSVDIARVIESVEGLPGITHAGEIGYACTDEAAIEIRAASRQRGLTDVVLAACSCCALDQICYSCTDRRLKCKANLLGPADADGVRYEFVNVREHCAWVHSSKPDEATSKAIALVRGGIARAGEVSAEGSRSLAVGQNALVIGGGLSGLRAAADLASQGFKTVLIGCDSDPVSGGLGEVEKEIQDQLLENGGKVLAGARLLDIKGSVGAYYVRLGRNGDCISISAGAIVVDVGGLRRWLGNPGEELPADLPQLLGIAVGSWDEASQVKGAGLEPARSRVPGVFLCGVGLDLRDGAALMQGSAAASKASALLGRGSVPIDSAVAMIDTQRCRGCGTCVEVCEFGAIQLVEDPLGFLVGKVVDGFCRGCGTCLARCPSGAILQNGLSDSQLSATLEAVLA